MQNHLEISNRRTGKTDRLIRNIVAEIKTYYEFNKPLYILICSPTTDHSSYIRKEILSEKYIDWSKLDYSHGNIKIHICHPTNIDTYTRGIRNFKRYFDEFDFCDLDPQMQIYDNDYFSTSPKTIRTANIWNHGKLMKEDLLYRLLVRNNFEYYKYANSQNNGWIVNDLFRTYNPGNWRIEFEEQKPVYLEGELRATLKNSIRWFPELKPYQQSIIDNLTRGQYTEDLVLILGKDEEIDDKIIAHANIVLRKTYKGYTIIKNRYGVNAIIISEHLLEKFLKNPAGKLVTTTDWI